LIAYTIWLWIQSPWALDQKMHLDAATYFSKYIIVYYIVYKLIDTPERVADFVTANMLGCFYLGWLAFTNPVSGRLDGVGGPGIDDSNPLGMHMAAVAVAGAMALFATKKWRRAICVLAMPFMLNTIVMAGSRGAFLALVAGGLVLFRLRPREDRKL